MSKNSKMSVKTFLQLFTSAVFVMCISREGIVGAGLSGAFGSPWSYDVGTPFDMPYGPAFSSIGSGLGLNSVCRFTPAITYGGGLAVTSASPIAPTGLTVESENLIEGVVAVSGQLPFLDTVDTNGIFQSVGTGFVPYGCGDGVVVIVAEAPIVPVAITSGYGYGGALRGGIVYNGFGGPVSCVLVY